MAINQKISNVTKEMCGLASKPFQSPFYKGVMKKYYPYNKFLKDPRNTIEGFSNRVLSAGTPNKINADDRRLIDLCKKSVDIASEMFSDNTYNLNTTQISEVIYQMKERGLIDE